MAAKKRCKHCGFFSYDMIKINTGSFCNTAHAISWGRKKADKERERKAKKAIAVDNKKHAAKKREFYDKDIKTRKEAAKSSCHAYIRKRDYGKPCICCNRPFKDSFHAGHCFESGNNPRIRYDENNIHGQSDYCNVYQGGDSDDYKGNLIKKIGVFEYWCVAMKKGGTMKRTADDYKAIELHFKNKLKALSGYKNRDSAG
jgi:hypothetical protein